MSLSPRKRRAVLALVEHGSVVRAADEVGISRQALHRWIKEPEFSQALREASSNMVEQASRRLTHLMLRAVDALEFVLKSSTSNTREKLRAAELILSHGVRLRELSELESRIVELEHKVGA
jgi:transposase-like protein